MTRVGTVGVFLNYQTPQHTTLAVASLRASASSVSAMVVVDNASADGSVEILRESLPDVRLIVAQTNRGFSTGCNLGIREALRLGAERVLLLNSDVTVPVETVGELELILNADPRLGIVGPVLISRDSPDQVQSLGIMYSRATGRMRHLGYGGSLKALGSFEPREVDGVSGCAMMIKREVLERIGLLEEAYFFGFEDLDFCLRAREAGFKTACIGTAVVLHEGSVTIGRASARRIYFATRNHLLLAARVGASQPFPLRWLRAVSIVGFNLAHVLLASSVPRAKGLAGFLRGVRDHLGGHYGPGPS